MTQSALPLDHVPSFILDAMEREKETSHSLARVLSVSCPVCYAAVGQMCTTESGHKRRTYHTMRAIERYRLAR